MEANIVSGIIAGIINITAFVIFNRNIFLGKSRPNTTTWTLSAILTVLNFTSYQAMTGDWMKSMLPTASSAACILTFLIALFKGKLSLPDKYDSISLAIGLFAGLAWWQYQSAMYANLILQTSIAVAFIPTFRDVWERPERENALPWYLWSISYVFMLAVVILRWRGASDLVYPINCLLLHGAVGLLTLRKHQKIAKPGSK